MMNQNGESALHRVFGALKFYYFSFFFLGLYIFECVRNVFTDCVHSNLDSSLESSLYRNFSLLIFQYTFFHVFLRAFYERFFATIANPIRKHNENLMGNQKFQCHSRSVKSIKKLQIGHIFTRTSLMAYFRLFQHFLLE